MSKFKRITTLLLALFMVLGVFPVSILAAEAEDLGKVHVIVENTTFSATVYNDEGYIAPWDGVLVDTWVQLNAESTMMSCVVDALESKGYSQTGAESNYISEINGLAEFDGGLMSGWMGTLNDWFTNEGFGEFKVENGKLTANDEIRIMYTSNGYGEDLGGSWGNNDTSLKALTFSTGTLDKAFDSATKEYTLAVPVETEAVKVTPTAANKNYMVKTFVGETEYKRTVEVPVKDGTVIEVKIDPAFGSMNGGGEAQTYTITVKKEAAAPAELAKLSNVRLYDVETGDRIKPTTAFNGDITEYTVNYKDGNDLTLNINSDNVEAEFTYDVNGEVKKGTSSAPVEYTLKPVYDAEGKYVVTIKVSAEGYADNTYTLTIVGEAPAPEYEDDNTLYINNPIVVKNTTDYTTYTIYQADAEGNKTESTEVVDSHKYYYSELPEGVEKFWFVGSPNGVAAKIRYSINDGEWQEWGSYSSPEIASPAKVKFQIISEKEYNAGTEGWEGKTVNEFTVWVKTVERTTLNGTGTESDPFLIETATDAVIFANLVNGGDSFSGKYVKLVNDIELPEGWEPVGSVKTDSYSGYKFNGTFKGTFDGNNKTITVPENHETFFGNLAGNALVKDLNIYGKHIASSGVVAYLTTNQAFTLDNITLKEGTKTLYSGFVGGYGNNACVIKNSTVEKGVVIGDDGSWNEELTAELDKEVNYPWSTPQTITRRDRIGSFGGAFNGTITNCVSYATVYGRNNVGGIVGFKGQSMRDFLISDCAFHGEVIATGTTAGGIVGSGYSASSGPNTPAATIENCYVTGSVTAATNVGGIFGGEELQTQNWNNGIGRIRNNYFAGTVKATAEDGVVGGVIGYMNSLDRYNMVENNYFVEGCGATEGIGKVNAVASDAHYGRLDDPTGADKNKLAVAVKAEALINGELVKLLNAGQAGRADWTQGEKFPVFGNEKHVYTITSSALGSNPEKQLKTTGYTDLENQSITVFYNDGTTKTITGADVEFEGVDFTKAGYQIASFEYDNYRFAFGVNVQESAVVEPQIALGDVNGDGKIDTNDAIQVIAYFNEELSMTDAQLAVADVDGNGKVDTNDAIKIIAYFNEEIYEF